MKSGAVGIVGSGRALGSRRHTNEDLCGGTLPDVTPEKAVVKGEPS